MIQALLQNNPFKRHVRCNGEHLCFLSRLFADEKWVEVFLFGSGYYHLHMAFPHISALFVPPNEKYQGTFRSRKFPHISHPKTQEAKTRLESSSIYPLFFSKSPKMSDFLLPTWFLTFPYVFTIIHLILTPFSTFFKSLFHNLYIRVRLKIQIKMHIQPVIL